MVMGLQRICIIVIKIGILVLVQLWFGAGGAAKAVVHALLTGSPSENFNRTKLKLRC